MDFTELRHLAEQIETECGKAIIGKGEQIRLVLTSLFAGGHVLIDDIPGVGKTTLVKASPRCWAAAWCGCSSPRICCPQTSWA
jgi:MoxR-like ATPase